MTLCLIGCQPGIITSISSQPTATSPRPPTAVFNPPPTTTLPPPIPASPTTPPTAILPTATATATPTPTPFPTPVPTLTPTATPIGTCLYRTPQDDLLTIVTLQYGLSRDYAPSDLVPLADYLPVDVTLGYPTEIRQVAAEPLVQMIQAMQQAGLQPFIISGYRSYPAQAIAWQKWNEREPERASQLSAPPGHSEHQLGTTVDFGSPELAEIVGQEDIEFHTYFYMTSEGQWLLENAHRYGFTLSYARDAFELTGFYYEPWHYRYVGVELATHLHQSNTTLTAYQLAAQPQPCIP